MIDGQVFMSQEQFIDWWEKQNPTEAIDLNEALTIYFNQETYEEGVI
jgi:hypothetical protein